jgi:hypothetical protein
MPLLKVKSEWLLLEHDIPEDIGRVASAVERLTAPPGVRVGH